MLLSVPLRPGVFGPGRALGQRRRADCRGCLHLLYMEIQDILPLYAAHPGVGALAELVRRGSPMHVGCRGLNGSAAAVAFAALALRPDTERTFLCVMGDEEEAGYFYHDLSRLRGEEEVLFFPSSFRRAVKYAQRDAGSEILRTEVLGRLSGKCAGRRLYIVTYPAALAERVPPQKRLNERYVRLGRGESYDLTQLEKTLLGLGFRRRDYVYEPGEFAVRGSILDVFSYAAEQPFRLDFFGDEIDSIRTFEVDTQLSRETRDEALVAAEPTPGADGPVPVTDLLPAGTCLLTRDVAYVCDAVERIKKQKKEGLITNNDVLRSEMQLTNDRLSLQETENSIALVSQQLNILLGQDETLLLKPDTTLLYRSVALSDYDEYIEQAYTNDPAMKLLKKQTELAENGVRLNKAAYLPVVSLYASNTLARPLSRTMADMYNNTWNVGLSVSYPLSSLFKENHRIKESKLQVSLRKNEESQKQQNIRIEVRTAYLRHKEALLQVEALKLSVRQAEENYRIMQNRYMNQLAILTDLLDANSVRLNVELQLTTARTRVIYTYYQLLKACGRI